MKSRLEVFVAAAQFSSLTKAARSLAISQPAVSKNIKELESEYNVTLFKRGAGKMELTPEGERFLVHARKILGCYRDLNEDLSYFSGGDISAFRKIKVGATAFLAAYVLPDLIEKYHSLFVNTEIELSSGSEDTDLFFTENGETVHASGESDFIDFPLFKYDLILGTYSGISYIIEVILYRCAILLNFDYSIVFIGQIKKLIIVCVLIDLASQINRI